MLLLPKISRSSGFYKGLWTLRVLGPLQKLLLPLIFGSNISLLLKIIWLYYQRRHLKFLLNQSKIISLLRFYFRDKTISKYGIKKKIRVPEIKTTQSNFSHSSTYIVAWISSFLTQRKWLLFERRSFTPNSTGWSYKKCQILTKLCFGKQYSSQAPPKLAPIEGKQLHWLGNSEKPNICSKCHKNKTPKLLAPLYI